MRIPGGILRLFKSAWDWDYTSEPDERTGGRGIYLCRGKTIGGSGSTNVLLYNRGSARDYDAWASECGAEGWAAADVLPYFKKAEGRSAALGGADKHHGDAGPFSVDQVRYQNPLSKAFLRACGSAGLRANADFNDWDAPQEGFGRFVVNEKDGERCSAATGYLEPALARENLHVLTGALARRVVFDEGDAKAASGVEFALASDDAAAAPLAASLAAGGEVLLAGGAINSPHTLMLSGIGPRAELEAHGVPVRKELGGVGANLQDHPAAVVSYTTKKKGVSVTSRIRLLGTRLPSPSAVLSWLVRRRGPLTSTGCDHGGFFKSGAPERAGDAEPDLQVRFLAARALSADGMSTFAKFRESGGLPDGYSFQSIVARPKSRDAGRVRLASADPTDKPKVEAGYLSDPADLATLRAGIKLGRELSASAAFERFGPNVETFPGADVRTDEQIDEYIRGTLHTSNALVGTCKMGRASDAGAVVDATLRVHGVKGLRVVDASVMPRIPGGQTNAATVMIAEKAADMIASGVGGAAAKTSEFIVDEQPLSGASRARAAATARTHAVINDGNEALEEIAA